MQIHKLVQGSDEWNQFRLTHFGASEAAAMLGLSPKMKRNELLHMKYTMQPKEFSDWVENVLFAGGHEAEELARPLIEKIIGDDLYPITGSEDNLSASFDGLTLCGTIIFEHKQWEAKLVESVRRGVVPDTHMPQLQQQLMISCAEKNIFTVSDGTESNRVMIDVYPDQEWMQRIRAGWAQFKKDLAEYVPRELTDKPQASAILQLPALSIQIKGEVTVSNLPQFKEAAETFIANIKTKLETDEDFSNAEATVKYCGETEKKLEAAKKATIAQTSSIDEVMRTIDFIKDQLRTTRLNLDKQVKTQKSNIKTKILNDGEELFNTFHRELEEGIDPLRLLIDRPNFAAVMKNKRTLESLHNAVDTEISRCKILANEIQIDIRNKLDWFYIDTDDNINIFPDLQDIIYKEEADFKLLVETRITDHKKKVDEAARKKVEDDKIEADRLKQKATYDAETKVAKFPPGRDNASGVSRVFSAIPNTDQIQLTKDEELKIGDDHHEESIQAAAILSMVKNGVDEVSADYIIKLISDGKIDHVTINY